MDHSMKNQWFVGLFVFIGFSVVLASIFFLGADRAVFKSFAKLHAEFDQVQGLNKGSVISFSGINIGNIKKITYIPETRKLSVEMKVEEDYLKLIPSDSEVEIRTQGALGDKYIFILPGQKVSESIAEGSVLPVAKASDLFGIISERGKETEKLFDIINNLHKLSLSLTSENQVGQLISNLNESSRALKETSRSAQSIMTKISQDRGGEKISLAIDRMESVLAKIDSGKGTLGALINDATLHSQLKSLLGSSPRKDSMKNQIRTTIQSSEKGTP